MHVTFPRFAARSAPDILRDDGLGEFADLRFVVVGTVAAIVMMIAVAAYVFAFVDMPAGLRVAFCGLAFGLFYCSLSYQLARYGTARRGRMRDEATATEFAALLTPSAPSVTVLIPSYKEEKRVLVQTILSAALAHYVNRRIVVLVDDPPNDAASLAQTYAAVRHVHDLLAEPLDEMQRAADAWRDRRAAEGWQAADESERLSASFQFLAAWLERLAADSKPAPGEAFAHVDGFFADRVLRALARSFRDEAVELCRQTLDREQIDLIYDRLARVFCADISTFERKRYANLSHEPSKAMNLNAYLGLMGGRYTVRTDSQGARLTPAPDGEVEIAASDYVLTLDADSVVLPDYILKLARILGERPEVAVAQTPYRAFFGARSYVERVAGATTDIQYLFHQGTTYFGASYWVGANALLRRAALDDIVTTREEACGPVSVYIKDNTVIEDTGSTIDLLERGWTVHNHPQSLAYSATPPDFGALAIQRKRWSNGGLIILPHLLRLFLRRKGDRRGVAELILRANYLLSPLIGNTAVFLLMVWAAADGETLLWTPVVVLPYFILYGRDLSRLGYRFGEIFSVSSLNLILMPVGFAGIFASLYQMVTGRKAPFGRTPKVPNRTFVPPAYFLFNLAMFALMIWYGAQAALTGQYLGTIIPAANVALYSYGLVRFVGVGAATSDLWRGLRARFGGGGKRARLGTVAPANAIAWQAVPDQTRSL